MSDRPSGRLPAVTLAALGVVYGDIGTSPLYAFKEAFSPAHGLPLATDAVFAVLSMIFWSVMVIVSLKYVLVMLRFGYRGEGGVLALLTIAAGVARARPRIAGLVTMLGVFAVALFYGDSAITPAISVLSAVEGLEVAAPWLHPFVVPVAVVVLVAVFLIQRRGTASVGAFFGPVMVVWFAVLGLTGVASVVQTPSILWALDPTHALRLVLEHPGAAMIAAGAVFLCLTGAEALYADMGHFGARPVRIAWFGLVLPALMLNYLGQGALVLREPEAVTSPFFNLVPDLLVLPLVALATLATVIASQAVISGAFSATQQASRLNFLPRLRVVHTSETAQGQIYIPLVNWLLLMLVVLLVAGFRSSDALASAYGIAVSLDLFLSSVILLVVLPLMRGPGMRWLIPFIAFTALLEFVFFAANVPKIPQGGWFPLLLAAILFTVLTTWRRGMETMRAKKEAHPAAEVDGLELDLGGIPRVPGTAVFFCSTTGGSPSAFLHNLKHNKVVHEQTLFVTVQFDDVPRIADDERVTVRRGTNGIVRVLARFGFREQPDIACIARLAARKGVAFDVEETSFFTSKPTIVSVSRRGLFGWRRSLFGWMLQNSVSVASYFGLPPNRVIELGARVAI